MSFITEITTDPSPQEILDQRRERNKEAQRRFREKKVKSQKHVQSLQLFKHNHHNRNTQLLFPKQYSLSKALSLQSIYTLEGNELYSAAAARFIAKEFDTTITETQDILGNNLTITNTNLPPRHGYIYAMLQNASLMGIPMDQVLECSDYSKLSRKSNEFKLSCNIMVKEMTFSLIQQQIYDKNGSNFWKRDMPENLHFTPLQNATLHHPSIDSGIVWPSMRDKLMGLLTAGLLDTNKLVRDILIGDDFEVEETAFNVYGDNTWDPSSWEVCEIFARKWPFLLDEEILHTTNQWRRRKGLHQLILNVGVASYNDHN